jgi:hypothetical protein
MLEALKKGKKMEDFLIDKSARKRRYVRSVLLGHSLKPSFIKLNFFSPSPNLLMRTT